MRCNEKCNDVQFSNKTYLITVILFQVSDVVILRKALSPTDVIPLFASLNVMYSISRITICRPMYKYTSSICMYIVLFNMKQYYLDYARLQLLDTNSYIIYILINISDKLIAISVLLT